MNLKEYEDFVVKMVCDRSKRDFESKILTGGLGCGGEGGEIADLAKKVVFHGMEFDEEARKKLIKEIGDNLFYLAWTAREVCGIGLQEAIDANVDKLNKRYQNGTFTHAEFMAKEKAQNAN